MNQGIPKKSAVQVVNGNPEGLQVIKKAVWPGKGLLFPKSVYKIVRQRKELETPGVYILWNGFLPGVIPSVYIGKSGNLTNRLDFHNARTGFWTHCAVFFSQNNTLMEGHIKYLEAILVILAEKAACCRLEGKVKPIPPVLSEEDQIFVDDFLSEMRHCLSSINIPFFEKPDVTNWIPLNVFSPQKGAKAPAAIRFWDNSIRDGAHWYQILTLTVEKLYGDGLLKVEDTPVNLGKNRYLIHTKPIHPTGKQFGAKKQVGLPPLYIEVNQGSESILKSTISLLQKCDIDPSSVHLQGTIHVLRTL